MAAVTRGYVDVGPAGFVARFEYDQAIVDRLETIQRHHWLRDEQLLVVEPHWPSVRRLLHIASDLRWTITPAARTAEARVEAESLELEFSVDVIHNGHGEAVFQCKLGDDDELMATIRALPGAYWEGEWCVPTDWERCCGPLLEIVESDSRLTVSSAAWRLLTEEDVTHLHVRSSAPAFTSMVLATPPPLTRAPAPEWVPDERDARVQRLSQAITAEGFTVSAALRGELLPFQIAGVRYILETQRTLLADETGLGKTVQALAALETANAYPALIVCPPDLIRTWQQEAEHWLPAARKVTAWQTGPTPPAGDVVILSYAKLTQHQQTLMARRFESIVADESHHLRNHASRRTRAALAVAARVSGLRLCLSSAPLPTQPSELVTQLAFLGVLTRHFGGFWSYADRYCPPQRTEDGTTFGSGHLEELEQRLRAHCYCSRDQATVLSQRRAKTRRARVSRAPASASPEEVRESAPSPFTK